MMSPLLPSAAALQSSFAPCSPFRRSAAPQKPTTYRDNDVPIWSAVDDVKSKAGQLSAEAQKEYSKASATAQAKAGQIELYSGKYYAACTLGGILACVWLLAYPSLQVGGLTDAGTYTYQRHPSRSGQMPSASRS